MSPSKWSRGNEALAFALKRANWNYKRTTEILIEDALPWGQPSELMLEIFCYYVEGQAQFVTDEMNECEAAV